MVAVLMVALAAACGPLPTPPPTPNPYGLRPSLGDGEVSLAWHAPSEEPVAAYDLQVIVDGITSWQTFETTSANSTSFTDVENRQRYVFRVRTAANGSTPAGAWSPVVSTTYVDLVLPVVRIDTVGHAPILDRDNYVPGAVSIDPNGSSYAAYSGSMGIRGRGNSTWGYAKKPYRIKLDTKSPIMGIATERDWVLLANAVDRSQLRTVAAMQASEATSMLYTPTLRHVEVVLNGQYLGTYLLTQHNEVGPDRVDITEMEEDDNSGENLTGGYRLEIDERLEENNEPGWRTPRFVPVVIKDPDPATSQQHNYIRNYVNAFESALYSPSFTEPATGWRRYVDLQNFIDQYLIQELTYNQDAFFSSTFMTKERSEDFLRFGPVWDFDNAMGSTRGAIDMPPEGWWARTRGPWMNRVFLDPTFAPQLAQRWNELKAEFLAIPDEIEARGAMLAPAVANDAAKWGFELHETDEPGWIADWLRTRIAWMDSQFNPPAP